MSQKKHENELNQDSFEYEDRISNVIITPKNKDYQNSFDKKPLNNSEKEPNTKYNYNIINYNSKTNKIHEEQNRATNNKLNSENFSNAEMEFLKGMKKQMGFSESQNLNGIEQQKLFETFLLFQKFISSQAQADNNANINNNNINKNNLNLFVNNQKENLIAVNNNSNNKNNNNNYLKVNGDSNIIEKGSNDVNNDFVKREERNFNSVPLDYIHQRKKSKGTLSNSNVVNEFKRTSTHNFSNTLEHKTGSLEKNQANTIELDKTEVSLEENKNDNLKILNATIEDKKINNLQTTLNNNNAKINNKSGFNRLKNKNKSTTSYECDDFEKLKAENAESENRSSLKENSKAALVYNADNKSKLNKNENKPIEYTPNKDIEFSNRSSFDIKNENMPNNFENFSAKKLESISNNKLSNKTSDNKNYEINITNNTNAKIGNDDVNCNFIKKLDSNDSIKKTNNETSENKNSQKNNLKKKLNEEDFMPKKQNLLNAISNNKNNNKTSATENSSKIENFDDIPIKSSHTNFLELFEKNLAVEEANIYGTIINNEFNNENNKQTNARRNNPRFKKEVNISAPTKEAKKYKYYSDNFEEKTNEAVNAVNNFNSDLNNNNNNNENKYQNEKINFGNYGTEKPYSNLNKKNVVGKNNKKPVNNKSVEKTNEKRLDPAAKMQEDKSINLNFNGSLSGSTHVPNSKGKFSSTNKSKNSKNNPLSLKEKENNLSNKITQQKPNAEASLKNLKNNILNKKLNKGLGLLDQDSTSSSKAEPISEKPQTQKNKLETADIQIKNLIPNPINYNNNNSKVAFHSGDKNLITFGSTIRESAAGNNILNKNNSTPQFTIGFNAPYLNQPSQATEKSSDEKKVTKLIKSLLPFNTNEDTIEENFTNENESPVKIQKGKNSTINLEDVKVIDSKDDQLDFFNEINKKINDRLNLPVPITKELNTNSSNKKTDTKKTTNKPKNTKETNEPITNLNINNAQINNNKNENLYEEKLKEMEQEIQQLKAENESVTNLKQEYQRLYTELNEEIDNFYAKKDAEAKEFEKWKEDEIRKIQKERKAGEAKSSRLNQNIIPSKKDKEEIECLKTLIAKIQEEFKIKDNNNKLTIEKLKRKLEESNRKVTELSKIIEELSLTNNTNKNVLMRSNSTNLIKSSISSANANNTINNSINIHNNINNKKVINYSDANSINNINNHSTLITPYTQGVLSRNNEELNSNKTNKSSINLQQLHSAASVSSNLINGFNLNAAVGSNKALEVHKLKDKGGNVQRHSEDLNKIASKQLTLSQKKDSKEIQSKNNTNNNHCNHNSFSNININNKSIELIKKFSNESESKAAKLLLNNSSRNNNIISDPNLLYNPNDDGVYDLVFLEKYHPRVDLNSSVLKHENFSDGKIVKFYDNDKREVIFPSGVRKEIFADGYQIVYFNNKDIKQVFPNGKQIYFFSDAKTIQTTFPDNLQVFKFENGQIEKHYGEGCKQIIFPDGTQKILFEDENIDDKNVD